MCPSFSLFSVFFSLSFSFFFSFKFVVPEDLSIARLAGLPWDQWSSHIAMPLVTQLREGIHPLLFPTDLTVNPIASALDDKKSIKLLSPVSKTKSQNRAHSIYRELYNKR